MAVTEAPEQREAPDPRARIMRAALAVVAFGVVWEGATWLLGVPGYILPPPSAIAAELVAQWRFLAGHAAITATEIVLGFAVGAGFGAATALSMALLPRLEAALRGALIVSQALPVFAIAPLLVIWFGFGLSSKIIMAALIIYFPIASTFYDGLRRTDPGLLDLARLYGAGHVQMVWRMRCPAAMPALASGLRVAATVAPIGAVVGEWVGASAGLGFLMLHANARMQTDVLFAALLLLAVLALTFRFAVDVCLSRALRRWPSDPSF